MAVSMGCQPEQIRRKLNDLSEAWWKEPGLTDAQGLRQACAIASTTAFLIEFLSQSSHRMPSRQQLPNPCALGRRPERICPQQADWGQVCSPNLYLPTLFREQNLAHPSSPDADVKGQGPAIISLGRP